MAHTNPGAPFRVQQIIEATAATSLPKDCIGYPYLTAYLTGSAALSAGTLIIEEASWDPTTDQPYGGTWSQVASVTLSSPFSGAGGIYAYHLPVSSYDYVRTRIGTSVVGGTLSVALVGC